MPENETGSDAPHYVATMVRRASIRLKQNFDQDEDGNIKSPIPLNYWPFGIAGASLFGLGLVGGYAFMSGDVKEEGVERERLKGMNISEKELAVNRKLAFRTALAR